MELIAAVLATALHFAILCTKELEPLLMQRSIFYIAKPQSCLFTYKWGTHGCKKTNIHAYKQVYTPFGCKFS